MSSFAGLFASTAMWYGCVPVPAFGVPDLRHLDGNVLRLPLANAELVVLAVLIIVGPVSSGIRGRTVPQIDRSNLM